MSKPLLALIAFSFIGCATSQVKQAPAAATQQSMLPPTNVRDACLALFNLNATKIPPLSTDPACVEKIKAGQSANPLGVFTLGILNFNYNKIVRLRAMSDAARSLTKGDETKDASELRKSTQESYTSERANELMSVQPKLDGIRQRNSANACIDWKVFNFLFTKGFNCAADLLIVEKVAYLDAYMKTCKGAGPRAEGQPSCEELASADHAAFVIEATDRGLRN